MSGITLPFLSVGGSSLVIAMFAAGMLANIARQAPALAKKPARRRASDAAAMSERVFALLAGGGTGGHTYPAIAVAQELRARGHEVRFVGGKRGIEGRVVPEAGFPIDLLPGRGLQRRLTFANIEAIAGAVAAVFQALVLVRRYRPRVVVGFGGYASFAVRRSRHGAGAFR